MLLLKAHPDVDFSRELIVACSKNLANDAQSEGSRAKYLYPLIKRTRQRALIEKTVLQKLKKKKSDSSDLQQLCDLALLMYKGGNAKAREIFLQRFDKSFHEDYEFCGEEQILKMDGLPGLFRLAGKLGKVPKEDRWMYEYRWYIDELQDANPHLQVYAELETAAETNPDINLYYRFISAIEPFKKSRRKVPPAYTVAELEEIINRPNKRAVFKLDRCLKMKQEEIAAVARNFLDEKKKFRKFKYLRFFYAVKFPFDYQALMQIARGRPNFKTGEVQNAVLALSHFSGDDIRALALKKISTTRIPCDYLHLLVSNYKAGDAGILLEIIGRARNFDEVHLLVQGIIAIYKANPGPDCKLPLEAMYHSMNCSLHRRDLVKLLLDNHVLSEQIVQELAYDSHEDLRKLYRSIQRQRRRAAANA
ncbi:hypothetical protein ACO0LL_26650 [Undibacterium sp. TC4M20W]|uniref:hypothetical protein n=1 Tax=Undibacterium sp. TC4M20W TaxID=3413052 RepID=UPI003BEF766B